MPLQATISDARGRRVPLVAHEPKVAFGADERSRRILAASSLRRGRPTRDEVVRGVLYGLAALPVLVLAGVAPAYLAFRTGLPWWAQAIAMLPTSLLPAAITVFVGRRIAARRIARIYVHAGLCASCGYDLVSIAAGDEGFKTCPECGAAWADR